MSNASRFDAAREAAAEVLLRLPRAIDGLNRLNSSLEASGVGPESLELSGMEVFAGSNSTIEQLGNGFEAVVTSIEQDSLVKGLEMSGEDFGNKAIVEDIESAIRSIETFVSSVEDVGLAEFDSVEAFQLGKLSGIAEAVVNGLEAQSSDSD